MGILIGLLVAVVFIAAGWKAYKQSPRREEPNEEERQRMNRRFAGFVLFDFLTTGHTPFGDQHDHDDYDHQDDEPRDDDDRGDDCDDSG